MKTTVSMNKTKKKKKKWRKFYKNKFCKIPVKMTNE